MSKWIGVFLILLFLLAKPSPACAHQPRLVPPHHTVEIKKPEVSQAFYAALEGRPAEYHLSSAEPFQLYVSILVPDLPDARRDFLVKIFAVDAQGGESLVQQLDGSAQPWTPFFEPFTADRYLEGPDIEQEAAAGQYRIMVSSPDNRGKYVLSVGRNESFSYPEALQTIRRLPAVKSYFNKSPWTAYFNLMGLFMLLALLLPAAAVYGLLRLWKTLA
jgi:hypothetical protein